MTAAPVDSLAMRRRDTGTELQRSAGARRMHCLCSTLFPQSSLRGAGKLPLDYIACMALLGFLSALLGFTMDLGIERLHRLRRMGMELIEGIEHAADPSSAAAWRLLRYAYWVLHALLLCWLAIGVTAKTPQAAGSGIPEMKSILSGSPQRAYLTGRTMLVKVFGLMLVLGSGLPLGKEGPFVHISCCVVEYTTHGSNPRLAEDPRQVCYSRVWALPWTVGFSHSLASPGFATPSRYGCRCSLLAAPSACHPTSGRPSAECSSRSR